MYCKLKVESLQEEEEEPPSVDPVCVGFEEI